MRRLLVSKEPTRSDVLRFFLRNSWSLVEERHASPEGPDVDFIAWVGGAKHDSQISFVDDRTVGHRYFVIKSTTPEREAKIEAFLRGSPFGIVPTEEVVKDFERAEAPAQVLAALPQLVLVAPDRYDPTFAGFFENALKSPDAKVRAKALGLITYAAWPELRPLIEELARDSAPQVRKIAERVLDIYAKLGIAP